MPGKCARRDFILDDFYGRVTIALLSAWPAAHFGSDLSTEAQTKAPEQRCPKQSHGAVHTHFPGNFFFRRGAS